MSNDYFYNLQTLNMLLKATKCHVAAKNIQYLIDGHPDTIGDKMWAELLTNQTQLDKIATSK